VYDRPMASATPERLHFTGDAEADRLLAEDPLARKKIEQLAMNAVMAAEHALGREPRDVSASKQGYERHYSQEPRDTIQ
jgi:hypothetical protein